VRAFVLAAGLGTRLRPLTDHLPKALAPVCGRPLLERTLELFASQGFEPLAVNTHHQHDQIDAFRHVSPHPFRVFHEQDRIRGTGGALRFAADFLREDDAFCVSNAEPLKQVDLRALSVRFLESGALGGLVCVPASAQGTMYYRAEDQRYLGTRADKLDGVAKREGFYIGVAFYRRELLELLTTEDFSIVPVWRRAQDQGHRVIVLETAPDIYWRDVGTPGELAQVHFDVLEGRSPLGVPDELVLDRNRRSAYPRGFSRQEVNQVGELCWVETPVIPVGTSLSHCVLLRDALVPEGVRVQNRILTAWGELAFE
jgi:NDP-sugar pyrophosphorylase family protein